ncbi:MAG TPA: hypothetical protein PLY52_05190 [Methanothrix sp.]|uniref:hypothetical protein n=1 Tax=Methanothrix sp. TaxID=90426 RepID=UPI002CB20A61|nr:hypothetical protein [Methanothrix sp.]MDI9416845.1 hypothetical protein [Euryarchaeota archaeon]HON35690.1 hypothetical protein [Methanothrix sp.]HRU75020.1 hypothetical protein [Methanothrix sp.]
MLLERSEGLRGWHDGLSDADTLAGEGNAILKRVTSFEHTSIRLHPGPGGEHGSEL